jgi:hypothetical protein
VCDLCRDKKTKCSFPGCTESIAKYVRNKSGSIFSRKRCEEHKLSSLGKKLTPETRKKIELANIRIISPCWRCGEEKKLSQFDCCGLCAAYFYRTAKLLYRFGVSYTPKREEIIRCWRCDEITKHDGLGCCMKCLSYLRKIAEKMYLFNTPYTLAVCSGCGNKFHRQTNEKYCSDCKDVVRTEVLCWRCEKKKAHALGCCDVCYTTLLGFTNNIYQYGSSYRPKPCKDCGKRVLQ